jgi:hypothetical protein
VVVVVEVVVLVVVVVVVVVVVSVNGVVGVLSDINVMKRFSSSLSQRQNKLECLPLQHFFKSSLILRVNHHRPTIRLVCLPNRKAIYLHENIC